MAENAANAEMKKLVDLTTRVDERLKTVAEKQHEINNRLNQFVDSLNDLATRVGIVESDNEDLDDIEEMIDKLRQRLTVLEVYGSDSLRQYINERTAIANTHSEEISKVRDRIKHLEHQHEGLWSRANKLGSMVVHAIWIIVVCYLLYKMGLNTPPLP